jgi:hypothetical protein
MESPFAHNQAIIAIQDILNNKDAEPMGPTLAKRIADRLELLGFLTPQALEIPKHE